MAFVNEKIPENYWGMVDSWNLKNGDHNPITANGSVWTSDSERDAYLIVGLHHFSEDFEKCALIWKGNKIFIKVRVKYLGDFGEEIGEYKVFHIEIPKALKDQKEECFEIIKEALWTKSQMGPECGRRPVTVYITEEPIFI